MSRREVSFVVEGQPVPKARPRVTKHGTYTPRRTREWQQLVGWQYKMEKGPMLKGDVALDVTLHRRGRRRADWDNLGKAVADALNGIAYNDDRQVVDAHVRVVYGADAPRAEVTLREIG